MKIMNNQSIYKGKIHLWVLFILWGSYVHMIFAYIHQWGNNPVNKTVLIILGVIWISLSVFLPNSRLILTIDDKFFVISGSSYWASVKIHITQIKDVSVGNVSIKMYASYNTGLVYPFDFTRKTVMIQTKSGKTYQIAIKNAQKIKEEIEKRMIINNITTS